jgi:hypothetical protein
MDYNDKERLKSILSAELAYIARQAVSSNKIQVEDDITKWLVRDLTKNGHTYKNGTTKSELVKIICDSNINKFAQVVEGANSVEKFTQDVTDLLPMAFRRMQWRKIEKCFGIQWKFHFQFPKNLYDKKVNSRTYSKRASKISPSALAPEVDPITLIPEKIREICQKLSEASDLQKKLIMCILEDPIHRRSRGTRLEVEDGLWLSIQDDRKR